MGLEYLTRRFVCLNEAYLGREINSVKKLAVLRASNREKVLLYLRKS